MTLRILKDALKMLNKRVMISLCALTLTGCASIKRQNFSPEIVASAGANSFKGLRFMAEEGPKFLPSTAGDFDVLALSGGGPDGAYGVGLLAGWTKEGTRPEFDVVTGVSTGALIASFAFLGKTGDEKLHSLYTGDHLKFLLKDGSPVKLLSGPSLYKNNRLKNLIVENVTPQLLNDIAIEHRKGRRLYVATANIDAQRMIIWGTIYLASQKSLDV